MRDYVIVFFILANLPPSFVRPYYGLLIYAWMSYMYPHMLAWSFAQSFPGAKLAAITTAVGTFVMGEADTTPLWRRESIAMMLLLGCFTLSTVFAVYPAQAWDKWQDVSKIIVMALVAAVLLNSQKRMKYFLMLIAFSIGFYGIKGGLFSIRGGGESTVWGPGTSVIGANNAIGLALNMCLPILWYLSNDERGPMKRILQIAFFLTIPAVMFTYSRGSAVGLAAVLIALVLKGRRPVVLLGGLLIAGIIALPLIPQKWWARQATTLTYEEDRSAMSRIDNWKFCWKVALDYPLTGAGFGFETREMVAKYSPEFLLRYGKTWDTHSIYFAMLTTHGFPGFFIFISTIGFSLITCRRIRRQVRSRPDLKWALTYCDIVEVSFLAFLVNGAVCNMEYFDLPYHLVAIAASLGAICNRVPVRSSETPEVSGSISPIFVT